MEAIAKDKLSTPNFIDGVRCQEVLEAVDKSIEEKRWINLKEMKYFVECVRDGKEPRETFEDGYIVNAILCAGYQSMKTGKWEKIKY